MNSHSFDHVDLRVSSFAEARKFYDVFLPALGFPGIRAAEIEVCYYAECQAFTGNQGCPKLSAGLGGYSLSIHYLFLLKWVEIFHIFFHFFSGNFKSSSR